VPANRDESGGKKFLRLVWLLCPSAAVCEVNADNTLYGLLNKYVFGLSVSALRGVDLSVVGQAFLPATS